MVRFKSQAGRDPRELAVLDMDEHLQDERLKQKYVSTMFDILAPGYDTFTTEAPKMCWTMVSAVGSGMFT